MIRPEFAIIIVAIYTHRWYTTPTAAAAAAAAVATTSYYDSFRWCGDRTEQQQHTLDP